MEHNDPSVGTELTAETPKFTRRTLMLGGAAAVVTAAVAGAGVVAFPGVAAAAAYRTVRTTPVRNGPSVGSWVVRTLPANALVDVGSQTAGTKVLVGTYPNNCTWNRLTDGTWIADRDLSTPADIASATVNGTSGGYFKASSGLPRTTAAILGRTEPDAAAWWAETHLGVDMYKGWCLSFCMNAWRWGAGRTNVRSADSAQLNWTRIPSGSKSTSTSVPRGALAYWKTKSADGHVAISAGSGYVVTSWVGGDSKIAWRTISELSASSGWSYLGWAWPFV